MLALVGDRVRERLAHEAARPDLVAASHSASLAT